VLLIVNTASRCGFTPQYAGLEELYERYKDRGFVILAFPANDFMGQEPGDDSTIKKFCDLHYKIKFPLFSKISVKGPRMAPLYQYLTTASGFNGSITWNFNKFLVDRKGRVIARFGSRTAPLDPRLKESVLKALGNDTAKE
jgi:glutathione peroxidase